MVCAHSKDSDQPGKLTNLIRIFAVCSMCSFGPKLFMQTAKADQTGRMPRLICLCWGHMPFCTFGRSLVHLEKLLFMVIFLHNLLEYMVWIQHSYVYLANTAFALDQCMPASVTQLDAPSDWKPGGRGFNLRQGRQHSFAEIDHEIFSTVILSLPLIQEGQLSVSGERMCTILVNRLED